jgi:hypothetical protein
VNVPAPWILTRVIQLNLFDNAQLTGALGQQAGQWVTPQTNPAGAAAALAQRVLASGLPADRVCVVLKDFGNSPKDQQTSDGGIGGAPTRFFRSDLSSVPNDHLEGVSLVTEEYSDRPYSHLLPINGGTRTDGNGNPIAAPMRAWMVQFVAAYKQLQAAYPELPTPGRWYFDCESLIAIPYKVNAVRMLNAIRERPELWSGTVVPGTTMTPAQHYAVAAAAAGWDPVVPPINTNLNAVDTNPPFHRNREVMTWWFGLCQRAQDGVMKHCAYDVLRDPVLGFGSSVVCGNYDDVRCDGEVETGGAWMDDRPITIAGALPTRTTRRVNLHKQWGGGLHEVPGGFWLGVPMQRSGQRDQPFLYPIAVSGWAGYPPTIHGHRQRDLWAPKVNGTWAAEADLWVTSLRVNRHTVESILASGGSSPDDLAPYVAATSSMWWNPANSEAHGVRAFYTNADYRNVMAMLRGKNVPEVVLFSYFEDEEYGSEIDAVRQNAANESSDQAVRVYATRVQSYVRRASQIGGYADAGETASQKRSRLEFTLRDSNGELREVELNARQQPVIGNDPVVWQTVLDVKFEYTGTGATQLDDFPDLNMFDINVEVAVRTASPGVTDENLEGFISLWNPTEGTNGAWVQVLSSPHLYNLSAPVEVSGGERTLRARVQGQRNLQSLGTIFNEGTAENPKWVSIMRLTHRSAGGAFQSRYDLAQLIPVGFGGGTAGMVTLAASDMNQDGFVDLLDVDQFFGDWDEMTPGGDFTLDDVIDGQDVQAFIDAFLSEN